MSAKGTITAILSNGGSTWHYFVKCQNNGATFYHEKTKEAVFGCGEILIFVDR